MLYLQSATLGGQFNPASPTVPIHISGLQCTGRERSLSECSYSSVNRQRVRQHTRNAGVICAGKKICVDLSIDRLLGVSLVSFVQTTHFWIH